VHDGRADGRGTAGRIGGGTGQGILRHQHRNADQTRDQLGDGRQRMAPRVVHRHLADVRGQTRRALQRDRLACEARQRIVDHQRRPLLGLPYGRLEFAGAIALASVFAGCQARAVDGAATDRQGQQCQARQTGCAA